MRRTFPVPPIFRRGPTRAFTLIEILLATLIASLILGATYSVYLAASKTWNRSRNVSFNYQYARAAFSLLEQHLRCALPPDSKSGITFKGEDTEPPETAAGPSTSTSSRDQQKTSTPESSSSDASGTNRPSSGNVSAETTETLVDLLFPPGKPLDFRTTSPELKANNTEQEPSLQSDSLQFVSTGQIHGLGTHNRADLCELRFFLTPPTSTELPTLVMLRNLVPTGNFADASSTTQSLATQDAQESQTQSSQMVELAPNVVSFDVVYFDGTEWVAEWNNKPTLPLAAEITLVLADPQGVSNPVVLTKLISLNLASPPDKESGNSEKTPEKTENGQNPPPPQGGQGGPPPQGGSQQPNGPRPGGPPPSGGENR
ncbi:MAG TPA: prepilin-type N-terminal cleavage/methylation domain-containing protein [Candidatus Sumerlaeota bacterium]|nr:prepilin-type N-terminal cleavage/methylation domain-containing protein [Candidatus Sumerlaeota bacterium]